MIPVWAALRGQAASIAYERSLTFQRRVLDASKYDSSDLAPRVRKPGKVQARVNPQVNIATIGQTGGRALVSVPSASGPGFRRRSAL